MTPPFLGGQGRSPRDIRDSANAVGWLIAAAALLVGSFVVRWWLS